MKQELIIEGQDKGEGDVLITEVNVFSHNTL